MNPITTGTPRPTPELPAFADLDALKRLANEAETLLLYVWKDVSYEAAEALYRNHMEGATQILQDFRHVLDRAKRKAHQAHPELEIFQAIDMETGTEGQL